MSHPAEVTEQWQSLSDVAGTPDQPSEVMQAGLAALERDGFKIHILADGTAVADAVEPTDRDGQTFQHGSLHIEQVA